MTIQVSESPANFFFGGEGGEKEEMRGVAEEWGRGWEVEEGAGEFKKKRRRKSGEFEKEEEQQDVGEFEEGQEEGEEEEEAGEFEEEEEKFEGEYETGAFKEEEEEDRGWCVDEEQEQEEEERSRTKKNWRSRRLRSVWKLKNRWGR